MLSLLIGSLASAEERQLGTLEWQILLPVPMWQQWTVKVLTTVSLSLILGVGMPLLTTMSLALHELSLRSWLGLAIAAPLLTIAALYVSTLSSSGVRALALGAPLLASVAIAVPQAAVFALTGSPGRLQRHWLFVLGPAVGLEEPPIHRPQSRARAEAGRVDRRRARARADQRRVIHPAVGADHQSRGGDGRGRRMGASLTGGWEEGRTH
jgi:hypothetical protein